MNAMFRTATFIVILSVASTLHAADRPPNVLLIYSDDHGWADLGAQGVDRDIRTPNLDQLARDGVRFTRGYVTAPQCVPSRAGVLTGRYQQRFGVEDNTKGPLPLEELTIVERLKPAGYISGQVGKWHLDISGERGAAKDVRRLPAHMPHGQGFDEYFRGELRHFFASHDLAGKPLANAPQAIADERFRVVVQTDAAVSFIKRRATSPQQPWFLYLAWYAPHVPLDSPEPWFGKTPAGLPKERRQALAMIAAMDEGLGRIRQQLRDAGMEKDTLIVFVGDNGAPMKQGAWNGSINAPLVGEKGMLTDGGIRVPFVAAWPGRIPAGQQVDHPVLSLDIAATACALAAGSNADGLDGVNLVPLLTGKTTAAPHDAIYWRWRSQAAVLEMPWKLVTLGGQKFLFDVSTPGGEKLNLIDKQPQIAARLEAKLTAWSKDLKPAGLPTEVHRQDQVFFQDHGLLPKPATQPAAGAPANANAANAEADALQGWVCRNGVAAVRDGRLTITPAADAPRNARVFLARPGLNITGPATITLKLRARTGGAATVTWRLDGQKDFLPDQSATFDWPAGGEWKTVGVELPAEGKLIHLRLTPPRGEGLEIESIELHGKRGSPAAWRFGV